MISLNNIKIWSKLIALVLVGISVSFAQNNPYAELPLTNVVIISNKITDDNVIKRELLVQIGKVPTAEQLELSRKRLINLYLLEEYHLLL